MVIYTTYILHYFLYLSLIFPLFVCLFVHLFHYQNLEPKEESNAPYPLIIGVSCVGIFVLAVLVIFLIRYCHHRKMLKHRRETSDVMPVEVAFPNPEKYHFQETTSKEDIVRFEETSMWKDPARYEKLAFSNATYQEVGIPNDGADNQEVRISYDDLPLQEMGILKKFGEK